MTLDILKYVLGRADDLPAVVRHLTEKVRELSGARTIVLTQCFQKTGRVGHKLLFVSPERRRNLAESKEIKRLVEIAHNLSEITLWCSGTHNGEAESILEQLGYGLSLALPLKMGTTSMGIILVLDLFDDYHIESITSMLSTLTNVVALVLRNSFLIEELQDTVTESKLVGKELKTSEERFRAMFEQAAVGVAQIRTSTGRFIRINQKYCDIVGYAPEEMQTLTFQKITHPG